MGLETATAIVLRTIDYQESSKIITVLTESHGKFALMARGAKKPKGPFSGVVEAGNTLNIGFAYKSNRTVQDLRSADLVHSVSSLRRDFTTWLLLFQVLERITAWYMSMKKTQNYFCFYNNFYPGLFNKRKSQCMCCPTFKFDV
jgi:DNA repair protein RecO